MTTLAQIAARALAALDDVAAATWSAERIREWCADGVRDYSQHHPRTRETTIATVAGQQTYDLPADAIGILSVEYPAGQTPPALLGQAPHQDNAFYARDDLYLYWPSGDATVADRIHLAAVPLDGQTIAVRYSAPHDLTTDPAADLSVPADHEDVLVLFVYWKATLHLQSAEQQNPSNAGSLLMSQLAANARQAERSYRAALAALRPTAPTAVAARWRFDKWEP